MHTRRLTHRRRSSSMAFMRSSEESLCGSPTRRCLQGRLRTCLQCSFSSSSCSQPPTVSSNSSCSIQATSCKHSQACLQIRACYLGMCLQLSMRTSPSSIQAQAGRRAWACPAAAAAAWACMCPPTCSCNIRTTWACLLLTMFRWHCRHRRESRVEDMDTLAFMAMHMA